MEIWKEKSGALTLELAVKGLTSYGLIEKIKHTLTDAGVKIRMIRAGLIVIKRPTFFDKVDDILDEWGIVVLSDAERQQIQQVKEILTNQLEGQALSLLGIVRNIRSQTRCSYQELSTLFLSVEGMSLGRYALLQQLDKAIERLVYTNATVSEIAYRTGYRNENQLIRQLETERGLPITHFLTLRAIHLKSSDNRIKEMSISAN